MPEKHPPWAISLSLAGRVSALGTSILILLAWAHFVGVSPGAFDQTVSERVADMSQRSRDIWSAVSDGLVYGLGGLVGGLSTIQAVRVRRWDLLALVLLAFTAIAANDWILKPGLDLPRPATATATSAAFPSGHTAAAMLLGGTAILVHRTLPERGMAGPVWALLGLTAATGLSRVLAGEHWPIDVLGAWAYGTAVLAWLIHWANWDLHVPRERPSRIA